MRWTQKKYLAIVKAPASVVPFSSHNHAKQTSTAIIYCEGKFGAIDGKTANGLVRHSEKQEILSVIDSQKAGLDAGEVLGDAPNAFRSTATWPTRWRALKACRTISFPEWRHQPAC